MSELVELFLEKAIPELEQAQRVGILNKEQVRNIIKKKRHFEYKLQRRSPQLVDFERYIEFEISVLEEIQNFRQKHKFQAKKKDIDKAIITRISKLYKRAVYRFNDQIDLWQSFIKFCGDYKLKLTLSGVYKRLLQLHPEKEDLWAQRGLWEFKVNKCPEAARKVLQDALKLHPNSHFIFHTYFLVELSIGEKSKNPQEDLEIAVEIANAIYEDVSTKNLSVDLCCQLYQTSLKFPYANKLSKKMLEDIKERFKEDEQLYNLLAKMAAEEEAQKPGTTTFDILAAAAVYYDEAVSKLPTSTMWEHYINFILDLLKSSKSPIWHLQLFNQLQELLKKADDQDCLSEYIFDVWLDLSITFGVDCKSLCQRATSRYPANKDLWQRYILSSQPEDLPGIYENAIRATGSHHLCQQFLDWTSSAEPHHLENAFNICEKYAQKVTELLCPHYLKLLSKQHPLPKLRKLFAKFKCRPTSNNLKFLMAMIEIESSQEKPSLLHIRQHYIEATRKYGKDTPHLWLAYIRAEQHLSKDNSKVDSIYFQATRTLSASKKEEFVYLYTMEKNGHKVNLDF